MSASPCIRFADCELDLFAFQLRRGGVPQPVEPQVFELLSYLARNPGRLVGKDELNAQVWGGRIVSDAALSSRIKSARRAIGDDGEQQKFIRTVHGRGFRFIAEIVPAAASGAVPRAPVARSRPAMLAAAGLACVVLAAGAGALHLRQPWPSPTAQREAAHQQVGIQGTLVAYSTQAGAKASDGTGRNGLYTEHLLHHLPAQHLSLGQVFANTHRDLRTRHDGRQVPEIRNSLTGDIYLLDPPPVRTFHGLVIGNSAYQHVPRLKNPKSDATDIHAMLTAAGLPARLVLDATAQDLRTAIDDFMAAIDRTADRPPQIADAATRGLKPAAAAAKPTDLIAFVYLSGQGVELDGRQYFTAVDSRRGDRAELMRTALDVTALSRRLGQHAAVQIVIMDICRDNPWEVAAR